MSGLPSWRAGVYGAAWIARRPLSALFLIAVFAFLAALGGSLAAVAAAGIGAFRLPLDVAGVAGAVRDANVGRWIGAGVLLAFSAVTFQGSVLRALVREAGVTGLAPRIGEEELRLAMSWIIGAIVIGAPAALLGGAGLAWGLSTELPQLAPGGLACGALIGAVFLIRFSLSAAATVARERLAFFHSWDLTVGAFWSVLIAEAIGLFLAAALMALAAGAGFLFVHGFDVAAAAEALRTSGLPALATWGSAGAVLAVAPLAVILASGPSAFAYHHFSKGLAVLDREGASGEAGLTAEAVDG